MRPATDLAESESGYIFPATAILLIPIVIFIALSVDVGGWVVSGNRVQAAADAGALAAAAHLPDQLEATATAHELAAANGYVNGVDGVTVIVTYPNSTVVRVSIEAPADRFFSTIVHTGVMSVTRYAEATSLSPVRMGSPTNVLGFGPYSLAGEQPANYWLLENNDCSPAHFGDLKAARYMVAPWGLGCNSSTPSGGQSPNWKRRTEGRDGGYFYMVTIPPNLTDTSRLMIFDPGRCAQFDSKPTDQHFNHPRNRDANPNNDRGTVLEWRMWDTNQTPLITSDDSPMAISHPDVDADGWFSSDECAEDLIGNPTTWHDKTVGWTETPFVFPANTSGEPETYLIQTRVLVSTARGWNYHGYWIRPDNGVTACTSIGEAVGSETCPTISAEDWIPTGARGAAIGDPMDLYLAEVGPEHAGRTLNISIWDAGEGMHNIQVIDPSGNTMDFEWEADGYGSGNLPDYGQCGNDTHGDPIPCLWLDPANTSYPPRVTGNGWSSHYRFNGRIVTLTVPLDSQADFAAYPFSGHGYWFRIRFSPTASRVATEWATFAVHLGGDPIRLTY